MNLARNTKKPNDDDLEILDVSSGMDNPSLGGGVHHQTVLDPLTPLPGGVILKQVADQRPDKRKPGEAAAAKATYRRYVARLVANGGDEVDALSHTLGLAQSDVEERRLELHESILAEAGSGRSLRTMLAENDLTKEARIRILRLHAFNTSNPAASLKALQLVDEIDQERVADANSYEAHLRELMGGKKRR